ncbi:amino acid adenylation domain-containing protein, partial [Actinophytocola sp.]|uniref:amino acid adenylation domain-containing protein n=1 Tax=Actinophytocola sp. TaxID=1872138 RepID=UPI00389A0D36
VAPAIRAGEVRSSAVVPADLVARLGRAAASLGVPVRTVLLAVHLRLVGLLSGARTVGTWFTVDGRAAAGVGPTAVGEFRLAVPVVVDRDVSTWRALIGQVAGTWAQVEPHVMFPVVPAHRGGTMDGSAFEYRELPARPAGARVEFADHAPAPFTVVAEQTGDSLLLRVVRADGDAESALPLCLRLLTEAVDDLDRDPRRAATVRVAGTAEPPAETAHGMVLAHARATPDAVAVVDGDRTMTYRELGDQVTACAGRLSGIGVGPGTVVALYLPRSADLVVAMLGILTAGAAFLPLDVEYPRQWSTDMLARSGADALITAGAADTLDFDGPVLDLGAPAVPAAHPAADVPVSPKSSAYVLYTSGSTGRPKGVEVPHGALSRLVRWSGERLGLRRSDRVAQRTPVAFDAGLWEIVAPLACGAVVVVVPTETSKEPAALRAAITGQSISVIQLVPSLLGAHLEAGTFGECPSLRMVLCGGEALPHALAVEFAGQSGARLLNVYGPAECAVDTVWQQADPPSGSRHPRPTVPIGTVVDGMAAYVLDELGEPVPDGVPGELHLAGGQLATGYRLDPAATADRFVPDHVGGGPGDRMYRTGDQVLRLPGGELEFLGRTDRQVKVRGVRIEIGEVEARLREHEHVSAVAVRVRRTASGPELVAYFTGTGRPPDLRAHLRERLAEQMVPARFVRLDRMPLLPNGKVDETGLPSVAGDAVGEYRPPVGPAEERLCRVWAGLLAVDALGRHDAPNALGANRITALRAAAVLGVPVAEARTPAELASRVRP